MSETRTPCTGGAARFPIVDRFGRPIHVGDRLRAQVCVGRYGQTRRVEFTVEKAHWPYCQYNPPGCLVSTEFDRQHQRLVCYHRHDDFEHGHETWAEILPSAAS